jgi:hypothetical protein
MIAASSMPASAARMPPIAHERCGPPVLRGASHRKPEPCLGKQRNEPAGGGDGDNAQPDVGGRERLEADVDQTMRKDARCVDAALGRPDLRCDRNDDAERGDRADRLGRRSGVSQTANEDPLDRYARDGAGGEADNERKADGHAGFGQ